MLGTLLIVAGIHAWIVAGALLSRGSALRHQLLAAILIGVGAEVTVAGFLFSGALHDWPHLLRVTTPLAFLYGPLCLAFCATELGISLRGRRWTLWHLLPALLVLLWLIPLYTSSAAEKLEYMQRLQQQPLPTESVVIGAAKRIHIGLYLFFSIVLLVIHRRQIPTRKNLWPAGLLVASLALIWCGDVFDFLFDFGYGTYMDRLQMSALAISVLFITGSAVMKSNILPEQSQRRLIPSTAEIISTGASLSALMTKEEPFLDSRLTLPSLADRLGMTTHELSAYLNVALEENFSSYINRHRIDKAKQLLRNSDLPITAIAFEAGFNSISTFNHRFRRITGTTPTAFRRELQD